MYAGFPDLSLKNPILKLLEGTRRVGCVATEGAAGATDSRSSAPRPRSLWWRPKEMAARVSRQAFRARARGSLWRRERSPISVTSAILLRDRPPDELQLGTDGFHKKNSAGSWQIRHARRSGGGTSYGY
jgi:hypothetical protein